MMPNPTVALVDDEGCPTPALRGVLPSLAENDVVMDDNGLATPLLSHKLRATGAALPNASVQLVNEDGTATRAFSALLRGLA